MGGLLMRQAGEDLFEHAARYMICRLLGSRIHLSSLVLGPLLYVCKQRSNT